MGKPEPIDRQDWTNVRVAELEAERDKLHKCLDAGPDELCGETDCPVCALRIQRDDLARRLEEAETDYKMAGKAGVKLQAELADAEKAALQTYCGSAAPGEDCLRVDGICTVCGLRAELARRCKCEFPNVDVPVNECGYHRGMLEQVADAERRAEEHDCMKATQEWRLLNDREWRDKLEWRAKKADDAEQRAEKAERERDGLKLRVRMADMRDGELAKAKDRIEELEASGSSDGSALGDVLAAAEKHYQDAPVVRAGVKECSNGCDICEAVRRYRKERDNVDPSTPGAGCGVCPECAASGDDPERCTWGIGKERGDADND